MRMWKRSTAEDEKEYRKWARENYKPGTKINVLWHPVVRHECEAMNIDANNFRPDGIPPPK